MQERLIDIIMYLLKEFNNNKTYDDYNSLSEKLIANGYTNVEINFALNWIFNNLAEKKRNRNEQFEYTPRANRLLHDLEKIVFSKNAYGYLLQMRQLGLLNDVEFEEIIDEALLNASTPVEVDDVKRIAALILFDDEKGRQNGWDGFLYPFSSNTIQ